MLLSAMLLDLARLCRPAPLAPPATRGKPRLLDVGRRILARDGFAPDSPLEGDGFELPVPRGDRLRFRLAQGHRRAGSAATPGCRDRVCAIRRWRGLGSSNSACRSMGATARAAARETFARAPVR